MRNRKAGGALCGLFLLCASFCSCAAAPAAETAPQNMETAAETTETAPAVTRETEPDLVTVTGDPLSPDRLTEFTYDTEWAESNVKNGYAGAFLDTLDPELKELYCRALSLIHSMVNLRPSDAIPTGYSLRAKLQPEGEGGVYLESGYTYESFRNAFYAAFTKETGDDILSRYPFFYSYNGELWYKDVGVGGDVGEIYQEYALTGQTDDTLEFKRISYSVGIGEPLVEYDPSKKDEYEITEVEFRFVKTADGWRAERFLNVAGEEDRMLFA